MSRERARVRMAAAMLVLAASALGSLALVGPAGAAQTRGDGPDARKRQAVEMYARELKDRERGKDVRVDRTIRSDYKGDRVTWSGYMSVQRNGPDRSLRVSCTVAFDGQNRITSFESSGSGSGSGGSGGGNDAASRACWREAERRGADVREVGDTADVGRGARLVMLRLDRRGELLCLYRGSATLYRPL